MEKNRKNLITICLISILMIFFLTGCGGGDPGSSDASGSGADSGSGGAPDTDFPVMDLTDIKSLALDTAEDENLKFQFPSDKWGYAHIGSTGNLTIMYLDTYETDGQVNINAQVATPYDDSLNETFMNDLVEQLQTDVTMSITSSEMRSFDGEPLIYMELELNITDEMIDLLIEQGVWTDEYIESIGGREFLMDLPKTNTVMIYAVVDGHIIVYGGTYYDDAQKKEVLEAMNVMLQTSDVK